MLLPFNLRDYLNFKEGFKNLVKIMYGLDPYALEMYLAGEALQAVKGLKAGMICLNDWMINLVIQDYGFSNK